MPHGALPLHNRLFRLLKAAGQEFGSDKAGRMGAALSYYTLFAMVPLLFLAVAATIQVLGDSDALDDLVDQAREIAGVSVADPLEQLVDTLQASVTGFAIVGSVLAALSASGIFLQVQGVLNTIFHAPEDRTTGIVAMLIQRGIALLSAVIIAVLVFAPIVAVGAVGLIRDLVQDIPGMPDEVGSLIANLGVPLLSIALLMLVVAATFHLLVRADVTWLAARRGGMFTAVMILLGAFGVGLFIQYAVSGDSSRSALGAFGGLAILLLFFNLMWQIYLFGAEVTKVYADYLAHGDIMAPSQRTEASTKAHLLATTTPYSPASTVDGAKIGVMALIVGLVVGWWLNRD